MSTVDITVAVLAWLALLLIVGGAYARDVLLDLLADFDRRSHIAACQRTEADDLDDQYAMPCAPDPRWLS